jgi:hypothetical protein
MPFSRLVALAFVGLFAVVNVAAVPLPMDVRAESMLITAKLMARQHAVAQRDLSPFNPIAAYVKRDIVVSLAFISGPNQAEIAEELTYKCQIPEEVAVQAPNGVVGVYKRQIAE